MIIITVPIATRCERSMYFRQVIRAICNYTCKLVVQATKNNSSGICVLILKLFKSIQPLNLHLSIDGYNLNYKKLSRTKLLFDRAYTFLFYR